MLKGKIIEGFKLTSGEKQKGLPRNKNHSTQDSRVVPHHGTNWAALWLTAQIRRDAVLSESYGHGYTLSTERAFNPPPSPPPHL